MCKILSIKIKVEGAPIKNGQVIYVSNHLSYLDIPVLGSILRTSFVAKRDVASWPIFGFLSRLQQTAYISRERTDAKRESDGLGAMLEHGKSLIMFPEGTSTDGKSIYPFKSSIFSIFFISNIRRYQIQPVTIKMLAVDNRNIENQSDRELYSWHLHMNDSLAEHLWRFAKTRGALIGVVFHPPVGAEYFTDRKTLAAKCHKIVESGLDQI